MLDFQPFRAVRPTRDKVQLVGSRSYVTYSDQDLLDKLAGNPYSFLHIIRPELDPGFRDQPVDARFAEVRKRYESFKAEGIFMRESQPAFYFYRQTVEGRVYAGLVGSMSVADYREGRVKVHEQTIAHREALFARYLSATRFNAEPVLLVHEPNPALDALSRRWQLERPEYEFTTTDRVHHALWLVDSPEDVRQVQAAFAAMDAAYIADGHHRSASSALLAEQHPENPAAQQMMVLCLPANSCSIFPFHRMVKDLGDFTPDSFRNALAEQGTLTAIEGHHEPEKEGVVHLCFSDGWWRLEWPASGHLTATERLDPARVNRKILDPLLHICDLRTDRRIAFAGGAHQAAAVEQAVMNGSFALGILLHAVSFETLKAVSDEGGSMPPKSTYVEPKLRSGITIFEFSE